MKVKQACRRDRPGGEPQGKGGALTNRGQKESSVCFSSISIAKLSICFEFCKACAVFFERMPVNLDFSDGRTRVRVLPEWPRRRRGIAVARGRATKRNRCEKRSAVRRKRGTKQKYSRRPIHFFPTVFVPLLSERVLRPSKIDAMRAYRPRAHSRVSRFSFFAFTPSPECYILL